MSIVHLVSVLWDLTPVAMFMTLCEAGIEQGLLCKANAIFSLSPRSSLFSNILKGQLILLVHTHIIELKVLTKQKTNNKQQEQKP